MSAQPAPIPYADLDLPALGSAYQVLRVNVGGTTLEYAAVPAATPGGSSGQVQFNDGGAFAGSNMTYDPSTNKTILQMMPGQPGPLLEVRDQNGLAKSSISPGGNRFNIGSSAAAQPDVGTGACLTLGTARARATAAALS